MANPEPPVVLGYDMISPLGTDLEEGWSRARAGASGIGPLTRFEVDDRFPVHVAGEVDAVDFSPYPFLSPRALAHWTSPIFPYGLLVVHRALERIGLEITPEIAPRVANTFSSAIGGIDALVTADRDMIEKHRLPVPFTNPNACLNMVGGKVSILTGATGPIVSTVTACATGNTSLVIGAMFLRAGMADVAICGAVDFPLVPPIVAGFATMNGAYKRKRGREEPPERASRPFAIDRRGFVVSEGAACIVIATREFAERRGLRWQIELRGWCTNADAHHFVAPRQDTIAACMRGAIEHAGLEPGQIDCVNAHAVSTKVGDEIEAAALREVFGRGMPPVVANKSQIGHAMGASSAIESILAMEGLRTGVQLPTLNYRPDPEFQLDLSAESRPLEQSHVLKNGFGFGGCNACLVFGKVA